MSVKAIHLVWEESQQTAGSLLVMLAMADHSDDRLTCFPSTDHLADKCRLSPRQVTRIIDRLIEADELGILKKGHGRGNRTTYRLFPKLSTPVKGDILSSFNDLKGDIRDTEKVTSVTSSILKEPSVQPSLPRTSRGRLTDDEFINKLKSNPAYKGIDIDREIGKMQAWLETPRGKGRKLTRGFVVNWLNKVDAPMNGAHETHQSGYTRSGRLVGAASQKRSSDYKGVGKVV